MCIRDRCLLVHFTGVRDFVPLHVGEVRTAARTALYIVTPHTSCAHTPLQPAPLALTVHGAQVSLLVLFRHTTMDILAILVYNTYTNCTASGRPACAQLSNTRPPQRTQHIIAGSTAPSSSAANHRRFRVLDCTKICITQ